MVATLERPRVSADSTSVSRASSVETRGPLGAVLHRHGVTDPEALLVEKGMSADVACSADPDVLIRGNVQLMKGRVISAREVDARLAMLKRL